MAAEPILLESATQRLQVYPRLGGSIVRWDWKLDDAWSPLFRPWGGVSEDRYTLACFPLVPWSNRITGGGFTHDGTFHPLAPNRADEPYPIHGDGWLQEWTVEEQAVDRIKLSLSSDQFAGNPYRYRSTQTLTLLAIGQEQGLQIDLTVTHHGERPLPYGLGLHPYFTRTPQTTLQMQTDGVWLSGHDPIPTDLVTEFPQTWDYNEPSHLEGPLIDNCFTGWNGKATIRYPDRGLALHMHMLDCNGYTLLYRPPAQDYFCLEPITHPIDAFHMENKPGLALLKTNDSLALRTRFLVTSL